MAIAAGFSGNEICPLNYKSFRPGNLVNGNSVDAMGLLCRIGSGFKTLVGAKCSR